MKGFLIWNTVVFLTGAAITLSMSSEPQPLEPEIVFIQKMDKSIEVFAKEADSIKIATGSSLSSSKITHLLVHIDGLCKAYDVPRELVLSVIQTESSWQHKARSIYNCRGLMQISKPVAKDYGTHHSLMYDPYDNVSIGIKHLSKLLSRYDGNIYKVLVAYSEGPRNVPSEEKARKRPYVKKVLASIPEGSSAYAYN